MGEEKPASGTDLPKTKFSQEATFIVTHTEADYATCYENGKDEQRPWSPIVEAVIA